MRGVADFSPQSSVGDVRDLAALRLVALERSASRWIADVEPLAGVRRRQSIATSHRDRIAPRNSHRNAPAPNEYLLRADTAQLRRIRPLNSQRSTLTMACTRDTLAHTLSAKLMTPTGRTIAPLGGLIIEVLDGEVVVPTADSRTFTSAADLVPLATERTVRAAWLAISTIKKSEHHAPLTIAGRPVAVGSGGRAAAIDASCASIGFGTTRQWLLAELGCRSQWN